MKKVFRLGVFAILVGGWALASAAIHVVRTPSKFIVIPKDQLGYTDTYVDTRTWTITDDTAHAAVVSRLVHLGKSDLLAHTVNTGSGPLDAQLATVIQHQGPAIEQVSLTDKAKASVRNLADAVRSKMN